MQTGVTIYYTGTLTPPDKVHDLISEVSDIARINNWKYQVVDNDWNAPVSLEMEQSGEDLFFSGNSGLKGIVLEPHAKLAPLTLLFDADGKCRSLIEMASEESEETDTVYLSTQEAGAETHIALMRFLDYVGKTYLDDWTLRDDAGYYLHQDLTKTKEVFNAVDDAIQAVTEAFETIDLPGEMDGGDQAFMDLIEQRIRTFLPNADIQRIDEEE